MKETTYKDYLSKVYDEFKDVDESSIRMIVRHGLSRIGIYKTNGLDVFLYNNKEKLYYYMGDMLNKDASNGGIKDAKQRKKLRLIYRISRNKYDGYQYFGLTEEEYKQWLINPVLDKVVLYRILKECQIHRGWKHFFKLKIDECTYWRRTYENFDTTNAEKI